MAAEEAAGRKEQERWWELRRQQYETWQAMGQQMVDELARTNNIQFNQLEQLSQKELQSLKAVLQALMDTYDLATDRGRAMASAVRDALDQVDTALAKSKEKQKSIWDELAEAGVETAGRIRQGFEDAIYGMMKGTSSFRDFLADVWDQLLRLFAHAVAKMVFEWDKGQEAMKAAASWLSDIGGGILSGIGAIFGFDNPKNDAWARKQGFDFGTHFSRGVATAVAGVRPLEAAQPHVTDMLANTPLGVMFSEGAIQLSPRSLTEWDLREFGRRLREILDEIMEERMGWQPRWD